MSDDRGGTRRSGLNPSLKSRTNTSRDTETPTAAPADTASVQRQEGQAWPMIWLIAVVLCVAIAIYLIFG